jgi:hypothetical protein
LYFNTLVPNNSNNNSSSSSSNHINNINISSSSQSYQRTGQIESILVIPHFKSQDAKLNMTSPTYAASNQEPSEYVQIEPFDSFNDYFISRSFLGLNCGNIGSNFGLNSVSNNEILPDFVPATKALVLIRDVNNNNSQQRYALHFSNGKTVEVPTNVSALAGLGTRVASTNYGEVRVGEILFRIGNPDKLIFSRRNKEAEYFAIKVINIVFIRQLENMRFKFPENPDQVRARVRVRDRVRVMDNVGRQRLGVFYLIGRDSQPNPNPNPNLTGA